MNLFQGPHIRFFFFLGGGVQTWFGDVLASGIDGLVKGSDSLDDVSGV